jgi:hypothetical protein
MLTTVQIVGTVVRQARAGDIRAATYYLDNLARKKENVRQTAGLIVVPADASKEEWAKAAAENQDSLLGMG